MKKISVARFNALASYARSPEATITGEELEYFTYNNDQILGLLVRDRTDNDFSGIIFAQDEILQYRWTAMTDFSINKEKTIEKLQIKMKEAANAPKEHHYQGHENTEIVDFFDIMVSSEKINSSFLSLTEDKHYSPAKNIMEPMMRWYDDVDGNFIEQFQTVGFDARLWELYLYATFSELNYAFNREEPAPDFVIKGILGELAIEAVTLNPSRDKDGKIKPSPTLETKKEIEEFIKVDKPRKFKNSLKKKLNKKYWEKPHIQNMPLIIAISDFSSPNSSLKSSASLCFSLYEKDGFFSLDQSENISAVIFTNEGNIDKFNRMGIVANFGSKNIEMTVTGTAYNHEPDAKKPHFFNLSVHKQGYKENWVTGLNVFHNPKATLPLSPHMLPNAAHHFYENDNLRSVIPNWHPITTETNIIISKENSEMNSNPPTP